jgi:hypothetical protein
MERIHMIPDHDSGWIVHPEREGLKEGHFPTREYALRFARTMCDAIRAELVIHDRDGTVTRE